jgi:hypothetical protein
MWTVLERGTHAAAIECSEASASWRNHSDSQQRQMFSPLWLEELKSRSTAELSAIATERAML